MSLLVRTSPGFLSCLSVRTIFREVGTKQPSRKKANAINRFY
jgi:hypothetical protein